MFSLLYWECMHFIFLYLLDIKFNDSIDRYRALLVTRFHQTLGFDYFETFSLVVKPTTICIVLTLALSMGWSIRQLDVRT